MATPDAVDMDPRGCRSSTLEGRACRDMAVPLAGMATASQVDAERPHLLALARRLAINPQDANDLVQDAIVRALPALGKVAAGAHLRAWLLTILRRMHVDQRRRMARAPAAVSIDDVQDALASEEPAVEPADTREIDVDDVHAAILSLPEVFRQVLVLHELEGRSYREIAAALDLPLATVGTRLNRGRLKLRDALVARRTARHD